MTATRYMHRLAVFDMENRDKVAYCLCLVNLVYIHSNREMCNQDKHESVKLKGGSKAHGATFANISHTEETTFFFLPLDEWVNLN